MEGMGWRKAEGEREKGERVEEGRQMREEGGEMTQEEKQRREEGGPKAMQRVRNGFLPRTVAMLGRRKGSP